MICGYCKYAGNQNAMGATELARVAHGQCQGGTRCDCQHVVGRSAKAGKEPK
jgi:hypothetical protein